MTKSISNYELDEILRQVIHSPLLLHHYSKDYFTDLYHTGCRSKELLCIERWTLYSDKAALNTFKTEAIRIFPVSLLSSELVAAIADRRQPYNGLTYDQLTREFRHVIRLHPIYAGDKIADTYLFRYNRARLEYDKTKNLQSVMDFFGWNSPAIASKYITTPLIYDPFRPG